MPTDSAVPAASRASAGSEPALEPGDALSDRFRVEAVLGHGASAVTYRARDASTGSAVAVKALRAKALGDWKQLELFEREARVLGGLRHHGVPEMIAFFERDDGAGLELFLAMELVDGVSLATRMREGPRLDQVELAQLASGILDVLGYLHSRSPPVYHRDIKPSNIIIRPDGTPVLIDFGGVCDGWRPPDDSGDTIVGTVGYMAPEQYMGQVGPWSDLYALGATLLHAIVGRAPAELDYGAGRIALPLDLDVAPRLRRFVDALLDPAPRARPASANDARRLLFEDAPEPEPASPPASAPSAAKPALVALGPAPRDPTGPAAAIYQRLRGHYVPPFGWLVHLLGFALTVGLGLGGQSVNLALVGVVAWAALGAGLSAFASWIDAKRPPDSTPGGWLFVHGDYATATITDREEIEGDDVNGMVLAYRFDAHGQPVDGSVRVPVLLALLNPPGARIGVLWHPDAPASHQVIVEDLSPT